MGSRVRVGDIKLPPLGGGMNFSFGFQCPIDCTRLLCDTNVVGHVVGEGEATEHPGGSRLSPRVQMVEVAVTRAGEIRTRNYVRL